MGILDLAIKQDRAKQEEAKEITPITTTSTSPVLQDDNVTQTPSNDKTIYVDGPISNIITHALNITYANVDKDTSLLSDDNIITQPATEEAAMDTTLVASIYAAVNKAEQLEEMRNSDVYIYATDDSHIEDVDDVNDQIGDLKIALDKCKASRKIFVMESHHLENPRIALLATYADEKGFDVIYTREKLMRSL